MHWLDLNNISTVPSGWEFVTLKTGKPVFLTQVLEREIMDIIESGFREPRSLITSQGGMIVPSNHIFLNREETSELRNRYMDERVLQIETQVEEFINTQIGWIRAWLLWLD
jgi:hypothetical protein